MTLGIKVGPQPQSMQDLAEADAPFAEVWFNILKQDIYEALFTAMKQRGMQVGLHFWGHLADGTWTNIAYDDQQVIQASMAQFKETIEIAARHSFQYVNIHPSTRAKVAIDLVNEGFTVTTAPLPLELSENIFLENFAVLDDYATKLGVVLTMETIPTMDTNGWRSPDSRLRPFTIYSLPNSTVVKGATMGFTVANDFGHTTCTAITNDRSVVWQTVKEMTQQLAPQTRLLHLGYVIPPYNGTDYHDHLDNPVFDSNQAVPNRGEMVELLTRFKDRADVWALVEPDGRHVNNYRVAKQMIDSIR